MRILTVIVNYRSAPLTIACLRSLATERSLVPGLEVVVVENDSGDDSAATLQAAVAENGWQEWATIRPMPRNGGFAYGVNAGVQPGLASTPPFDAFWLLNPDTYVRPRALAALVDFLRDHPEASMVGSRLEDADGVVRIGAAETLWRMGPIARQTVPALRARLDDPDAAVRASVAKSVRMLTGAAP